MKRSLFFLFFLYLFMIPAFADYTVDHVAVSADVDADGGTRVSMTLQLSFDTAAEEATVPLVERDVGSVSVADCRFKVRKTDEGANIILKKSDGFVGTQTFSISYSVPAGFESAEESVIYRLGLLSARWGRPIGMCTFQIMLPAGAVELPEEFALEPQIISGYHSTLSAAESDLAVTGTAISGAVSDRMAYDSLELEVTLPDGYFTIRGSRIPGIAITWLSVGMLIILLLTVLFWRIRLRTPHVAGELRLLAPEGVLPCELPTVLCGIPCDMAALILEWANLGYLSIGMSQNRRVYVRKTMQMGAERRKTEQKLFEQIFGGRMQTVMTPGRFSQAAVRFQTASRRALYGVVFDRRGGNLIFVQTPCRILLAVGVGYMAVQAMPEGAGFMVLGTLLGLAGLVYSLYLHEALTELFGLWTVTFPHAAMLALVPPLLAGSLLAGAFLEVLAGLLACVFSALVSSRGPRRSQRGVDALAQAKGCRMFFRQVSWQRLQILHGEDSRFFQHQLPGAVALRADRRFAKQFEQLAIPVPEWLREMDGAPEPAASLQKKLTPILRQIRAAFR